MRLAFRSESGPLCSSIRCLRLGKRAQWWPCGNGAQTILQFLPGILRVNVVNSEFHRATIFLPRLHRILLHDIGTALGDLKAAPSTVGRGLLRRVTNHRRSIGRRQKVRLILQVLTTMTAITFRDYDVVHLMAVRITNKIKKYD